MPFCSRCGRELLVNWEFCSHCGTSITAPLPIPTAVRIQAPKESHTARNILIGIVLVLLIVFSAAALSGPKSETGTQSTQPPSKPEPQTTPVPPTATPQKTRPPPLQLGSIIRIGESYTILGTEGVSVEVTFTRAYFTSETEWYRADKGYKLLILEIQVKNIGIKATECLGEVYYFEVTVDKGYIYKDDSQTIRSTSLRPEETKIGYVMFQILEKTNPLEVRFYDRDRDKLFVVDLRGETVPTKTAATYDPPNSDSYSWFILDDLYIRLGS